MFIENFFESHDYNPKDTFYLGDTTDDEPVAGYLPPGHFIVPFYATDRFRNHMRSEYGAFSPEDEESLKNHLL